MPLLAAAPPTRCLARGCMSRTDVMRTLLEQTEGVGNELATEGQERPVHLRSAVDFRFTLPIKPRPRQSECGPPLRVRSHASTMGALDGKPEIPVGTGCFVSSGLPPWLFVKLAHASKTCSPSMSMCTFPYAIVNALFLLAGSSALAPPLGGKLERGGRSLWVRRIWGRGSTDGVGRPIARGRGPPADVFLKERSRLLCRHRARPFLGASTPDRSAGPHLIDGRQSGSQSKTCIVHRVHLSLRHRHRRAFPPRGSVSRRSIVSGDRAGVGRSAHGTRRARESRRIDRARLCGVQVSLQLSGWSLR